MTTTNGVAAPSKAELIRRVIRWHGAIASISTLMESVRKVYGVEVTRSDAENVRSAVRKKGVLPKVSTEDSAFIQYKLRGTTSIPVQAVEKLVGSATNGIPLVPVPVNAINNKVEEFMDPVCHMNVSDVLVSSYKTLSVVEVVKLTRNAIEAAGGKDKLRELIDLL